MPALPVVLFFLSSSFPFGDGILFGKLALLYRLLELGPEIPQVITLVMADKPETIAMSSIKDSEKVRLLSFYRWVGDNKKTITSYKNIQNYKTKAFSRLKKDPLILNFSKMKPISNPLLLSLVSP